MDESAAMGQSNGVHECLTQIQNFSKINPADKFDNKNFFKPANLTAFKAALPQTSPKIQALLNKIKELDAADMAKDGHHYKHYVFSDVTSGGSGARILTSAFFAHGYPCAYRKNKKKKDEYDLVIPADLEPTPDRFVFLPGNMCWGKTLSKNLGKDVTAYFNRSENRYGDYVRFILLDSKYKEGIDLKDVKYCHLFDMLNPSDEKQAIGRGARHCGQKNLKYGDGWKLHVYNYNLIIPDEVLDEFQLNGTTTLAILAETNKDLSAEDKELFPKLMHEIDWVGPTLAVDRALTSAVHAEPVRSPRAPDRRSPPPLAIGGRGPSVYRGPMTRSRAVDPRTGKASRASRYAGRETRQVVAENKERGNMLRAAKLRALEEKELEERYKKYPLTPIQRRVFDQFKHLQIKAFPAKNACRVTPEELTSMPGESLAALQRELEAQGELDEAETELLENIEKQLRSHVLSPDPESNYIEGRAVQLSNMQKFITAYVKPTMPTKGILLWHSAGSGKTCAAVSMATHNFGPAGYSIVWVTRSNMTRDVQKNALGLRAGDVVCAKGGQAASHYGPEWCGGPIGYQTFSNFLNFLNSKNPESKRDTRFIEKYEKSVAEDVREARERDPLHKCLIIIDEAHKLYNQELPPNEAPDTGILETMIQNSYAVSKKDSVRVVLMTATPYSYSPFEFFQLMNLLRDKDKLPTTKAALAGNLTERGQMTPEFLEKFDGYISYADVSRDTSKFAQIEKHRVDVDMSFIARPPQVTLQAVQAARAAKEAVQSAELDALNREYAETEARIQEQTARKEQFAREMADVRKMDCTGKYLKETGEKVTPKMCADHKKMQLIPITVRMKETTEALKGLARTMKETKKNLKTTKKRLVDAATARWRELAKTYKKQTGAPSDRTQVSALRYCVSRKRGHKRKASSGETREGQ